MCSTEFMNSLRVFDLNTQLKILNKSDLKKVVVDGGESGEKINVCLFLDFSAAFDFATGLRASGDK